MQHLKEKQYYIDLYDKFTVDKCREALKYHEGIDDSIFEEAKEKPTPEEIAHLKRTTQEMYLYFTTGEEYKNKSKTIQEWIEHDTRLDRRVETAEEPQLIRCKTCASTMNCTSRNIWSIEDKVQFFFECLNKCLPHRIVYEDGSEYKSKPNLCEKCDYEMTHASEKMDEHIVTTVYSCTNCDHSYTDELDLTPKEDGRYPKNGTPFLKSFNNTSCLVSAQTALDSSDERSVSGVDCSS